MKTSRRILEKNLRQLEKEFPNEILPKERLPLLPREKAFSEIPLQKFDHEQLRFMINLGFGWKILIPMTIEILNENPFAEGDLGGLLSAVLSVDAAFWRKNPDLYQKVEEILQKAERVETEEAAEILTIMLPQKIYDFRKNKPRTDD